MKPSSQRMLLRNHPQKPRALMESLNPFDGFGQQSRLELLNKQRRSEPAPQRCRFCFKTGYT